ncbi:hypothetical protein Gotur_029652 [Gossypium turneri]
MEKLKDKRAVYEAIAQVIVLLIWTTLITELLLKFWVLKGMVEFDFKNLLLTNPIFWI